MGWKHAAVTVFTRTGGARLLGGWYGSDRLTVLAYHRVTDHRAPGFVGFSGNVSAAPEAFDEQMQWVARNFSPVTATDVARSLDGHPLPERPLLVTFDDGYRDNHDEALPILERHGIPATVFLATDHIASARPFWWDRVAWIFGRAEQHPDGVRLLGPVEWSDRDRLTVRWIQAAKELAEADKLEAIDQLAADLAAPDPGDAFSSTHLDWGQVAAMQTRGVEFGAHTCSHPILARVDDEECRRQVAESVAEVERQTGERPVAFAYPNGLAGDFGAPAAAAVAASGVLLAFTLIPGPARRREVEADPLRIPRIYIHHHDDLARFAAKAAGVPRIVG